MPFDYVIYLMLFIAFLYGLHFGIKNETRVFVSYTCSFALVFFLVGPLLEKIASIENVVLICKSYVETVFDFMKVNTYLIDLMFYYIVPFLLIRFILDLIIKQIFFRKNNHLMEKKTFLKRIFGAMLALTIGIQMSIFMLLVLNSFMVLDLEGALTQFIVQRFSCLKEMLEYGACVLGGLNG